MQLISISIKRLHDSLNIELDFNEQITLLVGINGGGKTSVLNVIDWLLRPNLKQLAVADYDRLALRFREKDKIYEITATKSSDLVILLLTGEKIDYKPITIKIAKNADFEDEDVLNDYYDALGPEKHEMPMWVFLKSLSRPTFISLDRTVSAESEEVHYFENSRGVAFRKTRTRSPLSYVQDVTSERYAVFRSKTIENDNELKAKIVMSALQEPEFDIKKPIKMMSKDEIEKIEERVSKYLSGAIKSTEVSGQVKSFFHASKILTDDADRVFVGGARNEKKYLFEFVIKRYRQIDSLAEAFNDFDNKNAVEFKSLSDYLQAVNTFFKDGNKKLYFDEGTGKLVFSFVDRNGVLGGKKFIGDLSSGERQILILFTFLAFSSHTQSVFIVDEPELSLHPKWQHEFMDVFLKLKPEETQLLLATHSPDIVGKHKSACKLLRGIN